MTQSSDYPVDEPHAPGRGNPEWLHTELQNRELRRSEAADHDRRHGRDK